MRTLVAIILLAAVSAFGQFSGGPASQFGSNIKIVPSGASWAQLTNTIGQATSGQTVIVSAGTYFGTNRFSWFKDGVNILFLPGVNIRHAISNASAAGNSDLFSDNGVARTAAIMGWANFYISNSIYLAYVSNKNSSLTFECLNARNEQAGGSQPLFQAGISGGGGVMDVTIRDTVRARSYDIFVVGEGGVMTARGHKALIAEDNQIVETSASKWAYFDFDIMEADTNTPITAGTSMLTIDGNTTVKAGVMLLHSNRNVQFFNLSGGESIIEATRMIAQTNNTSKMVDVAFALGPCKIQNTRIIGPTATAANAPIDLQGDGLILDDVEISTSGTYSISAASDFYVTAQTALRLDKPVQDTVAVNGGAGVFGAQLTNSYAGTNVFVSLNGHSHQVLVATNAMLLVLTNSTAIESGKEVTLTIYNNKATNMNIAYSAAGFRPMNQVQNTVTNAKSLILHITRIGTNNHIRASQQQN